jgi:hypothetical protein
LILFNRSDVALHSDFSNEQDARRAFTALDGETLLDQQGRFIPKAALSAFVYNSNGKLVATLKPSSATSRQGVPA